MRIRPVITALSSSTVLKSVEAAYSLQPLMEVPVYPVAYVYAYAEGSNYNGSMCGDQRDTLDIAVQIVAKSITPATEPLEDAREDVRARLLALNVPAWGGARMQRIGGSIVDITNSVVSWLDIYRVEVST